LGRQRVHWGSGRLLGDNEWQPRGGSIDAVRMWSRRGGLEVQLLGAVLAFPGALSPEYTTHAQQTAVVADTNEAANAQAAGAQLVGMHSSWQLRQDLGIELTGLARVARPPLPAHLTPGDTVVFDLRVKGEALGIDYAAEAAYQTGRVASFGENRGLSSYAFAADLAWQSEWRARPRFDATLAYASGDDSGGTGETLQRFDPILPEIHAGPGQMDLLAWSNSLQASIGATAEPVETIHMAVRYVYAALAEPGDRWSTAALIPVGAAPDNKARSLAHEIDLTARYEPWEALSFGASYSLGVLAAGGRAIMEAAGRGKPKALQAFYLEAQLTAP
jgi:hypothetical protein